MVLYCVFLEISNVSLSIFISISNALIDSGFSQALIQKKNTSQKDYSTVFYFNLIAAVIVYLILYSLAQPVSAFYEEPLLEELVKVMEINIIFSSFSIVQITILTKKLDFKTQSKASTI